MSRKPMLKAIDHNIYSVVHSSMNLYPFEFAFEIFFFHRLPKGMV